jgi:hypothetical protein
MEFATAARSDRQTETYKSAKHNYDVQRFRSPEIKARVRENSRRWKAAHPVYMRRYSLKSLYGLTLFEADRLFQAGCGICGCELTTQGRQGNTFNVDHNHITGVVRGGLCFRCNVALGRVDAVPGWLEKAQRYLTAAQLRGGFNGRV